MSSPVIRWIQRFDNFKRAFARLSEASGLAEQRALSDLERRELKQGITPEKSEILIIREPEHFPGALGDDVPDF